MEETIILSTVAEGIIASLGSLPVKEIVQLWSAEVELEKLKDTVSTIKDVLLDAEEQQDGNAEVRVWLKKLQKPMYDADDLLDDVSSEALPLPKKIRRRKRFCWKKTRAHIGEGRLLQIKPACNEVPQHPSHIGHKIKDIREKLDAIAADRKFHLEGHRVKIGIENKKRDDDTYSFVLEEDVIGREEDKKKVMALLLDSNVGKNVSILPIVGIGGLGKTTLAKLVFNDQEVKQHFELKVWGLSEQDSWSLFKKIAFEEGKEPENTSIVTIGREIVAKCVGVPLAIRTIGGLLYFKNPETEWLSFMTNELSRIPQNENDIIPTLKHLEIDECWRLRYMPRGLGELTNLQTLSQFVIPSVRSRGCGDLSELNRLNSLRGKLLIKIGRHGKDVALQCKAANLKEKKHLRACLCGGLMNPMFPTPVLKMFWSRN
ncbi:putative disease resistance protein RGA3 [Morella rubra]|uniref:Putative disease resistance protein RGA3 n=1 Tax=Morella rubra TaxID=262757 RepID=A0A6A1WJL1_9ROSI|nr:putative disease resistance protein RGA3 [Morella rubra]